MTKTADRSDFLPVVFGKIEEADDLFAHDANHYWAPLYVDLMRDAAFDALVRGAGANAGKAHRDLKTALSDQSRDPRAILADLLPDAAWYVIEGQGRRVQFIVHGDSVWLMTGAWNERTQRTTRSDALAAIYAAYDRSDQEAA